MIDIAILGASGRMGQRLTVLAGEHDCRVIAKLGRNDRELHASPQVLLDFSSPDATRYWLNICHERRIALLIGTTGLDSSIHDLIDQTSSSIPVLQASNTSLGVAVLATLARQAAAMLPDCDIEIVESHHRTKKDAPSGTALSLSKALAPDRKIPIHSIRIGDEIGQHTIHLAFPGERLELSHRATTRDTFAHGALRAAIWLSQQKAGRYTIADMLSV